MALQQSGLAIEGLDQLVRRLEKLGVQVEDLKAAFTRAGALVVAEAVARVPRLDGDLAATIRQSKTKNRARIMVGSKRVPYPGPVHFGWPDRNIEPQPFLWEAMEAKQDDVIRTIDIELDRLISSVGF